MRAARLKTVVHRVDPQRAWRRWVARLTAVSLLLAGATLLGYRMALSSGVPLEDPTIELKELIARLETRAAIDQTSMSTLRGDLAEARAQIDELERELVFYRGVLAPEEQGEALVLREPTLLPGERAGEWRYQLVVQQGARADGARRGRLQVTLSGDSGGQPTTLALNTLDPAVSDDALPLNFRYFQRFEGVMQLPIGFSASEIRLTAELTKPKSVVIERRFEWPQRTILGALSSSSSSMEK